MNIPREQQLYRGLVSLQVPEEEVLSSAVQEKLVLAGPQPGARKVSGGRGGSASVLGSRWRQPSSSSSPSLPAAGIAGSILKTPPTPCTN